MAVNFGDTLPQNQIAPEAVVQEPVVNRGIERAAGIMADSLQTVGQYVGGMFGSQKLDSRAKYLSNLNDQWLDYADAVEQNRMSMAEARMRMRADFRQATADDPSAFADLNRLASDFLSSTGLGHIVEEGTPEQKANEAVRQEAATNGITYEAQLKLNVRKANLQSMNTEWQTLQAQGGIVDETTKARGRQTIAEYGEAAYPMAQSIFEDGKARIAAGEDRAAVAADVQQKISMLASDYTAAAGMFDAAYLVAPLNSLNDAFQKYANQEIELSVLQGVESVTMAQVKQNILVNDPGLRNVMAGFSIFKDVGVPPEILQQAFSNLPLADSLAKVFQSPETMAGAPASQQASVVGTDANTTGTLQTLRQFVENGGNVSSEAQGEIMNAINNVVNSLYTQSTGVKDPTAYREAIELLGSPATKAFIEKNGGISAEYAKQAGAVITSQYANALIPAIQNDWQGQVPVIDAGQLGGSNFGVTGIGQMVPTSDVLVPRWNGSAVEFIPAPGYENNSAVLNLAAIKNNGNASIGVPLNNLINAEAALTGGDAKKIWEEKYTPMFGLGEGQEGDTKAPTKTETDVSKTMSGLVGSDTPAQVKALTSVDPKALTLESFNSKDIEIAKDQALSIVDNTSASDPEAVMNASNPVEFASAYLGKDEVKDGAAIAAFIKETTGTSLNPAQTAWCAAFVDAVLHATGSKGTGKLNARSYLNWGVPVDEPKLGDVVVLERGPDPTKGHVGFYAGNGKMLAGNSGDKVSLETFNEDAVLGYRRAS